MNKKKEKHTFKDRFKYWYNSLITDSKVGLVVFLVFVTIFFILMLSIPMIIVDFGSMKERIWDNFATTINAWWPFYEDFSDNNNKTWVAISKTLSAVFGLLLTSALIGYISERISQRFELLQRGKTEVIEDGHIVVIGYDFNNHTLLKELIKANLNRKILIIDEKDILDVKDNLKTNIKVPKGLKIIYRSIDSTDIDDLKKCSIESSYAVVIQPTDDVKTIKTVMALKKILQNCPENKTHIVSAVKNEDYLLKFSNEKDIMLSTDSLLAKIISVSNYETGLSNVLITLFGFDNSELYLKKVDKYVGLKYGKIMYKMYGGVPVGIYRNGKYIIVPNENILIEKDDELLYYTEALDSKVFLENVNDEYNMIKDNVIEELKEENQDNILVFGYNNKFGTIFNSFSSRVKKVTIANVTNEDVEKIKAIISLRKDINVNIIFENICRETLPRILESINHVIILSNNTLNEEQSDIENMILYLKLIKLREKIGAKWTIITELNYNNNRELIANENSDDFIVSSNIVSIMLAQMVVDYRLRPIFSELLSSEGLNICIEDAFKYTLNEEKISDFRVKLLRKRIVLLGYILDNDGKKEYIYNPNRNMVVSFKKSDKLILIKCEEATP